MKNKAAVSLGKLGGKKTALLYGARHFSEAGRKGMAKRWKNHKKLDSGTKLQKMKGDI